MRIEILANPKPVEMAQCYGSTYPPKYAVVPELYVLWGYSIQDDANLLAVRWGPTRTEFGISGWRVDFTLERRGPWWMWRRVRTDWAEQAADAKARWHSPWAVEWRAKRNAKAA